MSSFVPDNTEYLPTESSLIVFEFLLGGFPFQNVRKRNIKEHEKDMKQLETIEEEKLETQEE